MFPNRRYDETFAMNYRCLKHGILCLILLFQGFFFLCNLNKARAEWKFSHQDLDGAIWLTPYNYRYRMLKGILLLKDKQIDKAIGEFRVTLRYFPFYFDAASNLAVAHAQRGELEQAERIFKAILLSWPNHRESKDNLELIQKMRR